MSRVAAAGLIAWASAATACGEAGGEETAVRRDSAGIAIVESPEVDRVVILRIEEEG